MKGLADGKYLGGQEEDNMSTGRSTCGKLRKVVDTEDLRI